MDVRCPCYQQYMKMNMIRAKLRFLPFIWCIECHKNHAWCVFYVHFCHTYIYTTLTHMFMTMLKMADTRALY